MLRGLGIGNSEEVFAFTVITSLRSVKRGEHLKCCEYAAETTEITVSRDQSAPKHTNHQFVLAVGAMVGAEIRSTGTGPDVHLGLYPSAVKRKKDNQTKKTNK